jgi:hypothetical protein
MRFLTLIVAFAAASSAHAETPVERQCKSGKCTCTYTYTYIANTCKDWKAKKGMDTVTRSTRTNAQRS